MDKVDAGLPSRENNLTKEISLPREFSNGFGRALRQAYESYLLQRKQTLGILEGELNQTGDAKNTEGELISNVITGHNRLDEFIEKMEKSKKVTITNDPRNPLQFSQEREDMDPKEGKISLGKDKASNFMEAYYHHISHLFSQIISYGEILFRKSGDDNLREAGKIISNASNELFQKINPQRKGDTTMPAEDIAITTDSVGRTTFEVIIPVPKPNAVLA